jgi:UDP-N-acetylmuramoyl-tripeptide--D-alanyl-D-alanine ligase
MKLGEIISILGEPARASMDPNLMDREPSGYSIDSRTLRAGELFFAVRGEVHDGHRFVGEALRNGAIAAVVDNRFIAAGDHSIQCSSGGSGHNRLIQVNDTIVALQALASRVIGFWDGCAIAITGSSGKTSTKDMTAAVLSKTGRTVKSAGNLNNAFGLPLSVLQMESNGSRSSDFEYAVLEMGMNHKGEIERLAQIAPPEIGVVTNVGAVHLEFFPSIDAIADAKSELVLGVEPGGVAVLNADDHRVARMASLRSDIQTRTFGITMKADVMASEIEGGGIGGTRFVLTTPQGERSVRLAMAGRHNLYNALAAAAVAEVCDAPLTQIAEALSECVGSRMRGELLRFRKGFTVIDDSYNSNPSALEALVETMAASEGGRRIVAAGEMLELGDSGPALHRESGRRVAAQGVDLLIGVRGLAAEMVAGAREAGMKETQALFVEDPEEAAELLASTASEGDLILVKGSRGVRMESIVGTIKQRFELEEGNR